MVTFTIDEEGRIGKSVATGEKRYTFRNLKNNNLRVGFSPSPILHLYLQLRQCLFLGTIVNEVWPKSAGKKPHACSMNCEDGREWIVFDIF